MFVLLVVYICIYIYIYIYIYIDVLLKSRQIGTYRVKSARLEDAKRTRASALNWIRTVISRV